MCLGDATFPSPSRATSEVKQGENLLHQSDISLLAGNYRAQARAFFRFQEYPLGAVPFS